VTVSTLKIGKREFVVVPRKDFERLKRKAQLLGDQEAGDVAESTRRMKERGGSTLEEVRKRLRL
jgi:hypothetical protein